MVSSTTPRKRVRKKAPPVDVPSPQVATDLPSLPQEDCAHLSAPRAYLMAGLVLDSVFSDIEKIKLAEEDRRFIKAVVMRAARIMFYPFVPTESGAKWIAQNRDKKSLSAFGVSRGVAQIIRRSLMTRLTESAQITVKESLKALYAEEDKFAPLLRVAHANFLSYRVHVLVNHIVSMGVDKPLEISMDGSSVSWSLTAQTQELSNPALPFVSMPCDTVVVLKSDIATRAVAFKSMESNNHAILVGPYEKRADSVHLKCALFETATPIVGILPITVESQEPVGVSLTCRNISF